ncbi:MAG TPA: hypothetical protein DIW47_01185 [Bacteroidetes bacterium]|nr:hypothetical protein [Bacteroidota bacterium]
MRKTQDVPFSEGNLKIALRSLSNWCDGKLLFNNTKDCLEFYHGTLNALSNYATQNNNTLFLLVSKNLPEIADDEIVKIVAETNGSRSNTLGGGGEFGVAFLAISSILATALGLSELAKKRRLKRRLKDLKSELDKIISVMENPELAELYLRSKE